jgi:geranylgeranyl diphosphate synthase type I
LTRTFGTPLNSAPRPPETLQDRLFGLISQTWERNGAWPEFIAAMRQSLWADPGAAVAGGPRPAWLRLPLLCCEAAGGDPRQAEALAAAWAVLYAAAHLLDSAQDGDPPESWWAALGPGPAINAATGLIATCALLLGSAPDRPGPEAASAHQRADFFQTVLQMASGQHLDLTAAGPSLEARWRMAETKSGAFFGLACRAGARAAGIDERLVSHYSTYGVSLGLLLQIGDDLTDLASDFNGGDGAAGGRMALPIAYFYSVATADAVQAMNAARSAQAPALQLPAHASGLLESAGVRLYMATKVLEICRRGASALRLAARPSPAREQLLELLESTAPAL